MQYESFGTLSRAISPQGIASPHVESELAGEPHNDTAPFHRLSSPDHPGTIINGWRKIAFG